MQLAGSRCGNDLVRRTCQLGSHLFDCGQWQVSQMMALVFLERLASAGMRGLSSRCMARCTRLRNVCRIVPLTDHKLWGRGCCNLDQVRVELKVPAVADASPLAVDRKGELLLDCVRAKVVVEL